MGKSIPLDERFWSKVDRRGSDECWPWLTHVTKHGYGRFSYLGKSVASHRFAYEFLVGTIPDGLVIDHICHTRDASCKGGDTCLHRRCTNPAHMRPETSEINVSTSVIGRATHCKAGHLFDEANTRIRWENGNPKRTCRKCSYARKNDTRSKQRAEARVLKPPKPKPTHCRYGHPYAGDNLYVVPSTGIWQCKACGRASDERRKARRRAAA